MFRKSLVGILDQFQKTINDLQELQSRNAKTIIKNDTKVQVLIQESTELSDESAKAAAVEKKIADLIAV